jgi:uncharacterized Zn finger protein
MGNVRSWQERVFGQVTAEEHRYDAAMAVRYRCTSCGNLTRFDVVTTRRTRAFHHFTTGGELTVEDEELLGETVEAVTCRWCGPSGAVEVLAVADGEVVH